MLESLRNELAANGRVDFMVRARPSAPCTKVLERMDDESIKIAIAAVPEQGKANSVLVTFLAEEFGVSKNNIEIVSGHTSKLKHIRIRSIS